jgi:hypothetical protein
MMNLHLDGTRCADDVCIRTHAGNPHADLARERKAQELASVLLVTHATWADMIRSLLDMEEEGEATDPWFRLVEDHAGTNPASAATWGRVAEILEERAARSRHTSGAAGA